MGRRSGAAGRDDLRRSETVAKATGALGRRLQDAGGRALIWSAKRPPCEPRVRSLGAPAARIVPASHLGRRIRKYLGFIHPEMAPREIASRMARVRPKGPGLQALARGRLIAHGYRVGGRSRPVATPSFNAHQVRTIEGIDHPVFPQGRERDDRPSCLPRIRRDRDDAERSPCRHRRGVAVSGSARDDPHPPRRDRRAPRRPRPARPGHSAARWAELHGEGVGSPRAFRSARNDACLQCIGGDEGARLFGAVVLATPPLEGELEPGCGGSGWAPPRRGPDPDTPASEGGSMRIRRRKRTKIGSCPLTSAATPAS